MMGTYKTTTYGATIIDMLYEVSREYFKTVYEVYKQNDLKIIDLDTRMFDTELNHYMQNIDLGIDANADFKRIVNDSLVEFISVFTLLSESDINNLLNKNMFTLVLKNAITSTSSLDGNVLYLYSNLNLVISVDCSDMSYTSNDLYIDNDEAFCKEPETLC